MHTCPCAHIPLYNYKAPLVRMAGISQGADFTVHKCLRILAFPPKVIARCESNFEKKPTALPQSPISLSNHCSALEHTFIPVLHIWHHYCHASKSQLLMQLHVLLLSIPVLSDDVTDRPRANLHTNVV